MQRRISTCYILSYVHKYLLCSTEIFTIVYEADLLRENLTGFVKSFFICSLLSSFNNQWAVKVSSLFDGCIVMVRRRSKIIGLYRGYIYRGEKLQAFV